MKILSETPCDDIMMEVEMSDVELEILVKYGKANITDEALVSFAMIDILTKQLNDAKEMCIITKDYKKNTIQAMTPWTPEIPMKHVLISLADEENGSPKKGDMLAVNPNDPLDMRLVSEERFKDNYEEA